MATKKGNPVTFSSRREMTWCTNFCSSDLRSNVLLQILENAIFIFMSWSYWQCLLWQTWLQCSLVQYLLNTTFHTTQLIPPYHFWHYHMLRLTQSHRVSRHGCTRKWHHSARSTRSLWWHVKSFICNKSKQVSWGTAMFYWCHFKINEVKIKMLLSIFITKIVIVFIIISRHSTNLKYWWSIFTFTAF